NCLLSGWAEAASARHDGDWLFVVWLTPRIDFECGVSPPHDDPVAKPIPGLCPAGQPSGCPNPLPADWSLFGQRKEPKKGRPTEPPLSGSPAGHAGPPCPAPCGRLAPCKSALLPICLAQSGGRPTGLPVPTVDGAHPCAPPLA